VELDVLAILKKAIMISKKHIRQAVRMCVKCPAKELLLFLIPFLNIAGSTLGWSHYLDLPHLLLQSWF
jgi:hypothetical protein